MTRARQHLASGRMTATKSTEQERLREAFIAAAQDGDVSTLEDLFASEIVSSSDELMRVA